MVVPVLTNCVTASMVDENGDVLNVSHGWDYGGLCKTDY
jgi:hypothetical protein